MQATSAILGGTQSLHTNSKDEALSLPTEEAAQTALRTQQVLAFETGIPDVVDPLAGSYYIENLTTQIEEKATALIDEIDEIGGAIPAIENNFQQNKIADSAYDYQKSIENNEQIIVGINKFKTDNSPNNSILSIDQKSVKDQLERLEKFKTNRTKNLINKHLDLLKNAINRNQNLIPYIIKCIKNNCTLGEICDTMKSIYGEHV